MSLHQNILGLIDPRGKRGRAAMIWMKLFHERPVGADYISLVRAFGEPEDFKRLAALMNRLAELGREGLTAAA